MLRVSRRIRSAGLPLAAAPLLIALCGAAHAGAAPVAPMPANVIEYVRAVVLPNHPTTYEIGLYSSQEFPMTDSAPTLQVGAQTFLVSRYGADGTLHRLVFSLTRSQFLALHGGASVSVFYNPDDAQNAAASWGFGTLPPGLLTAHARPYRSTTVAALPRKGKG